MKNAHHTTLGGFAQVAWALQSSCEANCQQASEDTTEGIFNTFLCKRIAFMVIEVVFRGSRKRLRSAVNIADLRYDIVITTP